MKVSLLLVSLLRPLTVGSLAFSNVESHTLSRRGVFGWVVSSSSGVAIASASLVGGTTLLPHPARAFDGSGSTALSGYNPATKAEMKKGYIKRVIADVKDFNALGEAIQNGETEGKAWINFFIQFQRREPDEVGRTYAALVDLRGLPTKKKDEYEGGDGLLLANTYTPRGKPPDNTPAVKSFNKLSKSFDPIEKAGTKGDAAKAKAEWEKAKELFSQYLADVELPSNLDDPMYK